MDFIIHCSRNNEWSVELSARNAKLPNTMLNKSKTIWMMEINKNDRRRCVQIIFPIFHSTVNVNWLWNFQQATDPDADSQQTDGNENDKESKRKYILEQTHTHISHRITNKPFCYNFRFISNLLFCGWMHSLFLMFCFVYKFV